MEQNHLVGQPRGVGGWIMNVYIFFLSLLCIFNFSPTFNMYYSYNQVKKRHRGQGPPFFKETIPYNY